MKCCCFKKNREKNFIRLYINICEARTLLPSDINGWSDPYCKVSIGSEKFQKIYKTNYCKRTLNPKWNEVFIHPYDAEKDGYQSTLRFEIFDHDAMTSSDLLGSVDVPLAPYRDHKWIEQWHKLRILNKDGLPLRCRGYLRLKIQCVMPNQNSFLLGDRSDQTNIHDIRSDSFDTQQERINQIAKQNQINDEHSNLQQRKQVDYNLNVTEQARRLNMVKKSRQGIATREQQEPLLQEENLASEQNAVEEELKAPFNPQYDHIPPEDNN